MAIQNLEEELIGQQKPPTAALEESQVVSDTSS